VSSTIPAPSNLAALGGDRQNYVSWTASTNTETRATALSGEPRREH
jgi:hypothetical protein